VRSEPVQGVRARTPLCDSLRGTGSPRHCADMDGTHISTHDAERYYPGMVTTDQELADLEEHLLWCHGCQDAVLETQGYVDTIRVGLLRVNGA
jgi:hypothetical protein